MLAPAMPARLGGGLAMRLGQFLEALTAAFAVDLVVAPIFGAVTSESRSWPERLGARVRVLDVAETLDTHFGLIMRMTDPERRAEAFARYGLPSLMARLATTAALRCRELLQGEAYDLIHASRSYCAPLAIALAKAGAAGPAPRLTLDLDEDDGRVFRGLAKIAAGRGEDRTSRWNLLEARAFERLVPAVAPAFDRVWLSSPFDAASLRGCSPQGEPAVTPNSIGAVTRPRRRDDGRTLLFVGSLGYEPNEDAVAWFIRSIWPRLPHGLRFRIVGPGASEGIRRLGRTRGVEVVGWAPDLRSSYETATLCIAPLRVGAGTRIKLLESAAHGLPIVSTTLGAEGLGLTDGRHLWLADTPGGFAAAIGDALSHPLERARRAHAASGVVTRDFDRTATIRRLAEAFRALL